MTQREVVFKYQPGDLCWFYLPGSEGLTPGTVQIGFQHPWHVHPHYIIQVHDPAYLYFECRDEYTMTNNPEVLPAYSGGQRYGYADPRLHADERGNRWPKLRELYT